MSIILAINERCRIESDRWQWIVSRGKGNNWAATTFWERLEAAAKDCIYLELATRTEIAKLTPYVQRLTDAERRIQETVSLAAPAIPDKPFLVSLGAGWMLSRDRLNGSGRWRYHLINGSEASDNEKDGGRVGTYRSLDYALQQCLNIQLRLADSFDVVEIIASTLLAAIPRFADGCMRPGNAPLTGVYSAGNTSVAPNP